MSEYQQRYQAETGRELPENSDRLEQLFEAIATGKKLPPRAQQAVTLGFTAHTLNDSREDPELFAYYNWVLTHCFNSNQVNELTARLVGMAFTCANIFKSDLPQPITLNPWQAGRMATFPLMNRKAVVIENNGVFAFLLQRHPEWPLILQGGNDFNSTYVELIRQLEKRGMKYSYLGDLDSRGIQMAEYFYLSLNDTKIEDVTALQSQSLIVKWLARFGKADDKRTRELQVTTPEFQEEMDLLNTLGKFVEQEQLIEEYERLIPLWLTHDD